QVLNQLAPSFPLQLNSPNNQLGFAYAKEIVQQEFSDQIELFPLQRKDAGYDDQLLNAEASIASATAIRKAMLAGKKIDQYIPKESFTYLHEASNQVVTWENYFPLLKYQLTIQSEESLRKIYQMTEGLENRFKQYIKDANSFESFLTLIKTKRYTWTRLQRLLLYVLMQFSKKDIEKNLKRAPEIRVLGFNNKGQRYLREQKQQLQSPLISNVNQETKNLIKTDILAGEIYILGNDLIKKQDFTRSPIRFD